jgi:hypothetical protein
MATSKMLVEPVCREGQYNCNTCGEQDIAT